MAGKDFYYEFMSRHQDLSLRIAEKLTGAESSFKELLVLIKHKSQGFL